MRLILASTSPRRREILALLGLPFEVIAPAFNERVSPLRDIQSEVLDFAVGKAGSVATKHPSGIVIGSDTMISINGEKIGKPADTDDAVRMLRALAGRVHRIFTSIVLIDGSGGPGWRSVEQVEVRMRRFSEEEIQGYLACNESLDKAGAYSIQGEGRRLIESIAGDYLAAVGLPLRIVAGYLQERGIILPVDVDKLYRDRTFLNWGSF